MLLSQKMLFQVLISAVAFNNVACACPALASEMDSHAQHHSQTQSSTPSESCQHSACVTNCILVAADSSDEDAIPCNSKYQADELDATPPEFIAAHQPDRFADRTDPPPYLWVARDTPVRRFDRLLD